MARALHDQTINEIRSGLTAGEFRATELVEAYAKNIRAREREVKSFLALDVEGALANAKALDEQRQRGEPLPPLAGTVLAVKDNIAVQGLPATAASKILEGYRPPYDATVITRLRRAGVVMIGKTNLDEFAMGASTEQSGYFPTANPRDLTRVPGGSSGGSAAAVAANFATAALGSDTGGSVRQPAAFCGLVGLRPTYGAVSRYGLIAMSSSMDVIGPITRTVAEARALLAVMGGFDPHDATSIPHLVIRHELDQPPTLDGLRIGVPQEYLAGDLHEDVRRGFTAARVALEQAGATIVDVSLPTTRLAVPAYYVITPSEVSSNLARYDGVRFGQPADHRHGHGVSSAHLRGECFGPEPQRRILIGTFTLSAGYAERYYHTAQRVRTLIRQDFATVFENVDVLLTPTTPRPAFPFGSVRDPITMYLEDVFMAAVSLAGLPGISLPVPIKTALPVGVQLVGRQADDDRLLQVAEAAEAALSA